MEIELDELVNNIFNKQPQSPKSFQLQFIENLDVKEIFEFLVTFFTEGAKYKYGIDYPNGKTTVDLSKWKEKELQLMKDYFASIYFKLNLEIHKESESKHIDFNLMSYHNQVIGNETPLNTLKFTLKSGELIYVISFEHLL
jgi:hypothetical protein